MLAIKEIQAAGFEFVDYSDLHYRPDDELRYEVGRKTVTGNTDRWTLKFRKPQASISPELPGNRECTTGSSLKLDD